MSIYFTTSTRAFQRAPLKKPERTFCRSVRTYFREYCICTTIHGFKYFGEKRSVFERIWWFLVFLGCVTGCFISIVHVYKKWERAPVIVSFATKGQPIFDIPFPAITICPELKFDSSKINMTKLYLAYQNDSMNIKKDELENFEYVSVLCQYRTYITKNSKPPNTTKLLKLLDEIKPNFKITNCRYMGNQYPCIFQHIITDEGICYTYNLLDRTEIFNPLVQHYSNYHDMENLKNNFNLETGYQEDSGISAYPKRAILSGIKNAFYFELEMEQSTDSYCRRNLPAFKMLLHTPIRHPGLSQEHILVPFNHTVNVAISPIMITTSESVKAYNPNRRQCYFQSEGKLHFFKMYSSLNCKLECKANYTLKKCGCVDFYMPRQKNIRICGLNETACVEKASQEVQNHTILMKLMKINQSDDGLDGTADKPICECLPMCCDLTYNVELSQASWDWTKDLSQPKISKAHDHKKVVKSSVTVYFKFDDFIPSIRNELYGPTDFLANFGGLLGLFTGFSVLSLMEIIYFLSIRMICNSRLYGYWGGLERKNEM